MRRRQTLPVITARLDTHVHALIDALPYPASVHFGTGMFRKTLEDGPRVLLEHRETVKRTGRDMCDDPRLITIQDPDDPDVRRIEKHAGLLDALNAVLPAAPVIDVGTGAWLARA